MFITKQYNGEIEKFIEERKPYVIELEYNSLTTIGDIHKTVAWCQENFQGDGGGKIQKQKDNKFLIKWYISNKEDYVAFKLTWT